MQEHLERLRRIEVEGVREWFPAGARVLELGGGNGFQASILASWGCDVSSIDLPGRPMTPRHFPVQDYDGRNIPFADGTFDRVFSSSVLEHVPHLDALLGELHRVLRRDGLAVHILPSGVWRFWSSVTHYPHGARVLARALAGTATSEPGPGDLARRFGWRRILLPGPHGEYPNAVAELYYFSRRRWRRVFERSGFEPVRVSGNGLFYTGHAILPRLPLELRRAAARLLGSVCHIFVLRSAA